MDEGLLKVEANYYLRSFRHEITKHL